MCIDLIEMLKQLWYCLTVQQIGLLHPKKKISFAGMLSIFVYLDLISNRFNIECHIFSVSNTPAIAFLPFSFLNLEIYVFWD